MMRTAENITQLRRQRGGLVSYFSRLEKGIRDKLAAALLWKMR